MLAQGHAGEMIVLDCGWGLGQSDTLHKAPFGRAAAKLAVEDLTIVESCDKAPTTLILAYAQGRHLSNAALTSHQRLKHICTNGTT